MKPLDTKFNQNGMTYRQVKRDKDVAMYAVGNCGAVEVVLVGHAKETKWPNGNISPDRETYPNSEAFSSKGWYYMPEQRQNAENRYMELLESYVQRQDKKGR